MECYMMSRGRAQALAEAVGKMHPSAWINIAQLLH
jgi:hypothetical protein